MNTLAEIIKAARRTLGADSETLLAAVPTVARGTLDFSQGDQILAGLNYTASGLAKGIFMARQRAQTKSAPAFEQSEHRHMMVVIGPDTVDLHHLKVVNKVDRLIQSFPRSNFFYEQLPDGGNIDTLLTIGGNPYYVKRDFGPDLRATLAARGIDPGLETDL